MATFTPKELVYPVLVTSGTDQLLYTATGVVALVQTIHFQRKLFPAVDPITPGYPVEVSREVPSESAVLARAAPERGCSVVRCLTAVIPSGGTIRAKLTLGIFAPPSPSVAVYGFEIS